MKAWSQPEMEELNVRATAYSPKEIGRAHV